MSKIRIYNTTSFLKFPGFGLDFQGHYIGPNPERPLIIEVPVVPEILERWEAIGWAKVKDADDKTPVTKPSEAAVTPGTQVNEAASSSMDLEDDIFPDMAVAKEASLPMEGAGPAPLQSISQSDSGEAARARTKVTFGTSDRPGLADSVSPIPGDKPTSVDNSEAFTVRAPRHNGPGAVVKN